MPKPRSTVDSTPSPAKQDQGHRLTPAPTHFQQAGQAPVTARSQHLSGPWPPPLHLRGQGERQQPRTLHQLAQLWAGVGLLHHGPARPLPLFAAVGYQPHNATGSQAPPHGPVFAGPAPGLRCPPASMGRRCPTADTTMLHQLQAGPETLPLTSPGACPAGRAGSPRHSGPHHLHLVTGPARTPGHVAAQSADCEQVRPTPMRPPRPLPLFSAVGPTTATRAQSSPNGARGPRSSPGLWIAPRSHGGGLHLTAGAPGSLRQVPGPDEAGGRASAQPPLSAG
ncbi:hypothetical protein NDU88_005063 [Pleurodeles waltl]|uniref:Uncharacterized protein n=1 Tax=Pleurodeles waltl TaxID=8319 RepID=A0AAV7LN76_PLEWA|nr:hypothetical protein NDU88_005063 [Pleurodeles waltl]